MPGNSRSLDTEMSKISIRLTSSQRRQVEDRAKAAGKNVSDYVRGLATGESSSFSFHDIKIHIDRIESSIGSLILMLEQIQSSLVELSIIMLSRLPESSGTEEIRRDKINSSSIIVDIALDNAAKVVAKIHTIPDTPGFKDPMRFSEIDEWSRKYKRRENSR